MWAFRGGATGLTYPFWSPKLQYNAEQDQPHFRWWNVKPQLHIHEFGCKEGVTCLAEKLSVTAKSSITLKITIGTEGQSCQCCSMYAALARSLLGNTHTNSSSSASAHQKLILTEVIQCFKEISRLFLLSPSLWRQIYTPNSVGKLGVLHWFTAAYCVRQWICKAK